MYIDSVADPDPFFSGSFFYLDSEDQLANSLDWISFRELSVQYVQEVLARIKLL